ncbi:MAG TPA: hypothetical protein VMX18_01615 [Candidatus Bipolaricaulota bacterium]|nr:hypothetical protein [Candidatus Bipolaricaulota bacterium]
MKEVQVQQDQEVALVPYSIVGRRLFVALFSQQGGLIQTRIGNPGAARMFSLKPDGLPFPDVHLLEGVSIDGRAFLAMRFYEDQLSFVGEIKIKPMTKKAELFMNAVFIHWMKAAECGDILVVVAVARLMSWAAQNLPHSLRPDRDFYFSEDSR